MELGGMRLRNRVAHASITTRFGKDHRVSERLIAYHANRASGGCAMIVTEPLAALQWQHNEGAKIRVYDDGEIEGLARWADAVERHDCRLLGQLQDPGRGRHHPRAGRRRPHDHRRTAAEHPHRRKASARTPRVTASGVRVAAACTPEARFGAGRHLDAGGHGIDPAPERVIDLDNLGEGNLIAPGELDGVEKRPRAHCRRLATDLDLGRGGVQQGIGASINP